MYHVHRETHVYLYPCVMGTGSPKNTHGLTMSNIKIPYFLADPFKILEKLVEAECLMFLELTQRLIYPLLLIIYHSSY